MNRAVILILLAVIATALSGCAQEYSDSAMSSHAVDIPNEPAWPQ